MKDNDAVVYVVDDDEDVRKGLRRQLESAGYRVVLYDSARAFLRCIPKDPTSCLILDVKMPKMNGTELQEHLAALDSHVPVIFLSGHADVPMTVKAMKRGAFDFLQKTADDEELLAAVENALNKSREIKIRKDEIDSAREKIVKLSPRELEVFRKVIRGALNKQIAAELGVVEQTIKFHRGSITQKIGMDSVADFVRLAATAGIDPA